MVRVLVVFIYFSLAVFASHKSQGATIYWNTFDVCDFSSWEEDTWLVSSALPYAPGVYLYGNGEVLKDDCFCADGGGSYWVHSYFGDVLCSYDDYTKRTLLVDINYTSSDVIAGEGLSGHEYFAIIGITSDKYSPGTKIETYYGWIELDGLTVVGSALTADGPLIVGTGQLVPEPSGGLLVLLGCAGLLLRRRGREVA